MKLLYFTSKPIYPSVDGGCFASKKFLSCLLHANIDVQYVTLSTNKHPFDLNKFPSELVECVNPIDYFVNTDVSMVPALKSLFSSNSYNADRFYLREIEALLTELIKKEAFDGIIFDSLYTLPYLEGIKPIFNGKIGVRTHNVEFRLWEQYAEDASGIKKWYLKRLAKDLKRFELQKLKEVKTILSISKDDSAEFKSFGVKTKIVDIPVNMNVGANEIKTADNRIYHLGMMDWEPNRQAVNTLIEWMPDLRRKNPQLELHIAGSKSEEFIQEDTENGIHVHGFVDSVDDFAKNHGILVSPIQAASGVRIKFLEAMSIGIPIITTPVGALGIEYKSCNCISIAESKDAFISQIVELSTNGNKREEIGRNALNYIDKNHNIDAISQSIVEIFKSNS
ncbi:MAG: glycosyltransferase family 4 protein [Crocinitomicaceae bacterium]|nr:glycosyltransferase family 4 protein [Crocinitomicaceae bacterium]